MKLLYVKTASNRLADNRAWAGIPLAFERKAVDLHLPNLVDNMPAYLSVNEYSGAAEVLCNFSIELLAEKEPARFFLHRYLSTHDGAAPSEDAIEGEPRKNEAFWSATDEQTHYAPGWNAEEMWRMDRGRKNMPGWLDRSPADETVESYFLEPYDSKAPVRVSAEPCHDGTHFGYATTPKYPEEVRAAYGEKPDADWIEIYANLRKADPEWVRAAGCAVVAKAIKLKYDDFRARYAPPIMNPEWDEENDFLKTYEELRPVLVHTTPFMADIINTISALLAKDGIRVCEVYPRVSPTFEVYDAPIKEDEHGYVATKGRRGACMYSRGMPGVIDHSEESLAQSRQYELRWYDGLWMVEDLLPAITLPTESPRIATGVMRMQEAMDAIHFNEEWATSKLKPAPDKLVFMRCSSSDNNTHTGMATFREKFYGSNPFDEMVHYNEPKDFQLYEGDGPRASACRDNDMDLIDHRALYQMDLERDDWRYRICRMFYTILYPSRHFPDNMAEAIIQRRLREMKEVLTRYAARLQVVYAQAFGAKFSDYQTDFEKDPVNASQLPADMPRAVKILYSNIALLHRLAADLPV